MSEGVVAITGCDCGFGNQAAKTFAEKGFRVVAGCLTAEGRETLRKEVPDKNLIPVPLDVTSESSVKEFVEAVEKECQGAGLKGLVNNAGIAPTGFVEWAPTADLQKAMDINVFGQVRVTKACLPLLRKAVKAGGGRVVNVSSMVGLLAFDGCPWYACTKFAVEGWTDSFRREMRPFGIKVSLVEPGFFKTNMVNIDDYEVILKKQYAALSEEAKQAYGPQQLTDYVQNVRDQVAMMADPDTSKVINAMVDGVTARFPKTRYLVGGSAKYLFVPISYLPVWIADGILAGLNQKYKPAGAVANRPGRTDLKMLWLLGLPLTAYGLCRYGWSKGGSIGTAFMASLYLTSKWS